MRHKLSVLALAMLAAAPLHAQGAFTDRAGPPTTLVGGWEAVTNPRGDPQVRAAARAVLPNIPRRMPRLARIERAERQIVAGINYRLAIRLMGGSRWTALVWQKLDGTMAVSEVTIVR